MGCGAIKLLVILLLCGASKMAEFCGLQVKIMVAAFADNLAVL